MKTKNLFRLLPTLLLSTTWLPSTSAQTNTAPPIAQTTPAVSSTAYATGRMDASGREFVNQYPNKIRPQDYEKWIAFVLSREAQEQVWLRTLEQNLGNFYFPPFLNECIRGKYEPVELNSWGYVKDDPRLPRVLIIGNSISRSYTVAARLALKGLANVHRAPANCGRSEAFFTSGEEWIRQNGSDKWDIITVGYGISEQDKKPEVLKENLKKIVDRLRLTGAKLYIVTATPWYDKKDPELLNDRSGKVNATLVEFAKEQQLDLIDHTTTILPRVKELQRGDGVHFNQLGEQVLGEMLAEAIKPALRPKQ